MDNLFQEFETAVPYPLAEAQMLELSGKDARAFAHSQFTSDVNLLSNGEWQWSAWLDANGRVRNLFALLKVNEDLLLAWLPRGQAASMAAALMPFVFRSKVRLQALADYALFSLAESAPSAVASTSENWTLALPGNPQRGIALVKGGLVDSIDPRQVEAWARDDIAVGLPWISEENSAEFTPQALGLERFEAVSLKKGCYPGQEIVARLHYRGGNKRGCMRLQIDTGNPPMPGTEIRIETTPPATGRILYAARLESASCEALAVLPLNLAENVPLSLPSGTRIKPLDLNNWTP